MGAKEDSMNIPIPENLTPEQEAQLAAMTDMTNKLSEAMAGASLDVCLAALMNNMGRMLEVLRDDGRMGDVLMRSAVGLNTLANMAAQASGMLEPHAPGASSDDKKGLH
jgi:hypothetical protein